MAYGPAALPMTVISGYLGAGKTTFVNRLLEKAERQRVMVLVNDFGEISLDEKLVTNRDGEVISLANGCMCCQIGGDLYRTIDRVLGMRDRIDRLVVETSGVADPTKIIMIAMAEPDLKDAGVLTVVDALNFSDQLADPVLHDTLVRQVAASDHLLLTKHSGPGDPATAELLLSLGEMTTVPVILDLTAATDAVLSGMVGAGESRACGDADHAHHVPFRSWSWQGETFIDPHWFASLLREESLGIYRCKALLKDRTGDFLRVDKVGARISTAKVDRMHGHSMVTVIGKSGLFDPAKFEAAWKRGAGAAVPVA